MADRFDLFRLTLLPRPQIDAFEPVDPSRDEYLRMVFGQVWAFTYLAQEYHYRPDPAHSTQEAIVGRLGRQIEVDENAPPEQGFEDAIHVGWKASVVVVDPTSHLDGQKAAMEIKKEVGSTIRLMAALSKAINDGNPRTAFAVEALPVFDGASFWEFAEENKGEITSLTFDLSVPNGLWSAASELRSELAAVRDELHAKEVITTFKSDIGLETDADTIKSAVDYAEGGSGFIRARTKKGRRYSSTSRPKSVSLPDDEQQAEPLIARAARLLSKIMGRE